MTINKGMVARYDLMKYQNYNLRELDYFAPQSDDYEVFESDAPFSSLRGIA